MFLFICFFIFFMAYMYTDTKEQLNKDTLQRMIQAANIVQPDWQKIAKELGFKKFLQSNATISPKYFLERWHAFARSSQPSWELLGTALREMKDYKQVAEQIQQNAGKHTSYNILYINIWWRPSYVHIM